MLTRVLKSCWRLVACASIDILVHQICAAELLLIDHNINIDTFLGVWHELVPLNTVSTSDSLTFVQELTLLTIHCIWSFARLARRGQMYRSSSL